MEVQEGDWCRASTSRAISVILILMIDGSSVYVYTYINFLHCFTNQGLNNKKILLNISTTTTY